MEPESKSNVYEELCSRVKYVEGEIHSRLKQAGINIILNNEEKRHVHAIPFGPHPNAVLKIVQPTAIFDFLPPDASEEHAQCDVELYISDYIPKMTQVLLSEFKKDYYSNHECIYLWITVMYDSITKLTGISVFFLPKETI